MGYFRAYYNRVRRVGDLGNCWDEIKGAAQHGATTDFAKLDANQDGKVTGDERPVEGGNRRGQNLAFDFFAEEGGAVDLEEAAQLKAKWAATEKALANEPVRRSHRLAFDMSLAGPGSRRDDL